MKARIAVVVLAVCAFSVASDVRAQPSGRRRALLVGINDYTASRIGARPRTLPVPGRDWPNLSGAVNDTNILAEMLVLLYGFDRADILTLLDQSATRTAILQAIDRQLVQPAAKGDVVLFYFAGHGSQVRNLRSEEPDRFDESIVPADSRIGALDIRDKELQVLFNRIIDKGARLTVVFDSCHSGSGARGLITGTQPRGVRPDPRDVADASRPVHPEARDALIISAAQDFDSAYETRDANGLMHGAFTWALMRAMRDASPGESGSEVFLRAQARLEAESPFQEPVLAGTPPAKLRAFLGDRRDRRGERTIIGVEKVRADGTVVLQGGWAHGLEIGTELRVVGEPRATTPLTITAIRGLGESEGRFPPGRAVPLAVSSGKLMEVVGWAAPPGRSLRVWMPRVGIGIGAMTSFARKLAAAAERRGIRWITDPIDTTPTHVLRRVTPGWELLGPRQTRVAIGDDAAALAAIAHLPITASLFVQFPAPAGLVEPIAVGPGTEHDGIEPVERAEEADYILTGRFAARRLAYAWVRPLIVRADRRKTGLPLRTEWLAQDGQSATVRDSVVLLRDAVLRLRRIQGWHLLDSPPDSRFPYHLAVRRSDESDIVRDGAVTGGNTYELLLRAASRPSRVAPRYIYAFVIDSFGAGFLLFPKEGSVENRFPLTPEASSTTPYPPADILLGRPSRFEIVPPYGIDSYFLLSTDEPLPDPSVLEWSGVRTRAPGRTPLEQLLASTGSSARTPVTMATPANWSLEKVVLESVAPRTKRGR